MLLKTKNKGSNYSGVGIDIGNYSIKVAGFRKQSLLNKKNGAFSFGIEYVPKEGSFEQKAELIKKALENAGISSKSANISLSGPNVVSRYVRLPYMRKYELQSAIELEWDKYIALKRDKVLWDFSVLDTIKEPTEKHLQVLLVAAKKEFIDERVNLLKLAGIEPESISIDAVALVNAFKFTNPLKNKLPIAILNLGEYFTNEVVLKKGVCWFSRDINIGGNDITGIIANKLRIPLKEAEELKRNLKDNKKPQVSEVVKLALDNLVNELKLSLDYLNRELGSPIESIYILGGGSSLFQLEEILNSSLNIPVKRWDVKQSLKLERGLSQEEFEKHSPELAVALGLALSEKDDF